MGQSLCRKFCEYQIYTSLLKTQTQTLYEIDAYKIDLLEFTILIENCCMRMELCNFHKYLK